MADTGHQHPAKQAVELEVASAPTTRKLAIQLQLISPYMVSHWLAYVRNYANLQVYRTMNEMNSFHPISA